MTDEAKLELHRMLQASQSQYTYFILAAAGAAIAFAISQTQNSSLSYSLIPLGIAVICWGLSFYFGCHYLKYSISSVYNNIEFLKVQQGQHEQFGPHPQTIAGIRRILEKNSDQANRLFHWQFRFLILGGLMYVVWHVLEMLLRT